MGLDYDRALDVAGKILPVLDRHLDSRDWLATDHATLADVAVFGYVALSADAEISLEPYANIRAWIERVKSLPRFIPMPGIETNKAA
jgi:glutathione S-transferase